MVASSPPPPLLRTLYFLLLFLSNCSLSLGCKCHRLFVLTVMSRRTSVCPALNYVFFFLLFSVYAGNWLFWYIVQQPDTVPISSYIYTWFIPLSVKCFPPPRTWDIYRQRGCMVYEYFYQGNRVLAGSIKDSDEVITGPRDFSFCKWGNKKKKKPKTLQENPHLK